MNFVQPAFLWSLTAITVPVAIHLLSRREGKVVKVGSLRHLGESNTSRFKSLRLNEIMLLLARCLMIAWLALFLSGAQCTSGGSRASSRWLLIEQGMHDDKNVTTLIDSLTREGFELRSLAEGFPAYNEEDSIVSADYWGLVDQLREKQDHEIVVLSYSFINGFTQERISRPSNVLWISIDPGSKEFASLATRIRPDSVAMRIGYSDDGGIMYTSSVVASHRSKNWIAPTSFNTGSILDSVMIRPIDTIRVSIVDEKIYTGDARNLKAALHVIEKEFSIRLSETTPENADWTFWFRNERAQKTGGNIVVMMPQSSLELIRQTSPSQWTITRRLTPDEAVSSHLVTELAALLLSDEPESTSNDIRSMPEKMIWAQAGGLSSNLSNFSPARNLSTVLMLLFLLTWIAERAMAHRKNL